MQGAATSPFADVFAYAAAQVKKALEVTHELGGGGYTFWGGREGYSTLLKTDLRRDMDHLERFMHLAVDYKKKIGFKGSFYIEPKPKEPTKHQYDSDADACLTFLREYDLLDHFKLNIETNHATLAGHSMQHELEVAAAANALGSIDADTGDELLGWDTDQFPHQYFIAQCMLVILNMGVLTTGGVDFDAKVCLAHVGVIQVFEENAIYIDTIVGSSMGAYIAAVWAFGHDGATTGKLARKVEGQWSWLRLLDPVLVPRSGLLRGEKMRRRLKASIGDAQFSDLVRPLRAVATNLHTLDGPLSFDACWHDFHRPGKYIALSGRTADEHLSEITA